ncbi:YihY/virulence factor BrkB family protein [Thermodesulfobacteriota bacterium]
MTFSEIIKYLKDDIWTVRLGDLPRKKSFLIKQIRVVLLAFKGFDEDKCSLRASALTFYSLLSVVPAAALAFGIAKGFGMQGLLEKHLIKSLKGQEEVVNYIINFAGKMLEEARGGVIAGIGVVILVWLIIKLLGNIEKSFNDIWGVTHQRAIGRKLSDYLSILFVAPLLFVLSSSATVLITTQIAKITEKIDILGPVSPLIVFSLKILPYCVVWLLLTFVYIFMPNTKVKFNSGLLGGIVAGTIYVIVQFIYIKFQVGVARAGAIYGSLAGLPLFMVWLQVSWYIILFGAEVSFAHQNVDTYEMENKSLDMSRLGRRILSLRIAQICVKNFIKGEIPWSEEKIAETLELPIRLARSLLSDLVESRVLSETVGEVEKTIYYQPARDVNTLSINFVLKGLENLGTDNLSCANTKELDIIRDSMNDLNIAAEKSNGNLLLKDI